MRWFKLIESNETVSKTIKNIPEDVVNTSRSSPSHAATGAKVEGKFVDLPGATEGNVVVRFPPEASGYFIFTDYIQIHLIIFILNLP